MAQGAYFGLTGIWPIFHLRSFEAITGPKPEGWLVKTVGAMIGVIGGVLAAAGYRKRVTPEIRALAVGSAAALGFVDAWYSARRRISPVYALDALVEAGIVGAWALSSARSADRSARNHRSEGPAV